MPIERHGAMAALFSIQDELAMHSIGRLLF